MNRARAPFAATAARAAPAPPRRRWCRRTTAAASRAGPGRAPARRAPRTPGQNPAREPFVLHARPTRARFRSPTPTRRGLPRSGHCHCPSAPPAGPGLRADQGRGATARRLRSVRRCELAAGAPARSRAAPRPSGPHPGPPGPTGPAARRRTQSPPQCRAKRRPARQSRPQRSACSSLVPTAPHARGHKRQASEV